MGDPFEGLFESGEVLERVAVNLTTQARRGDLEPVRCRDAEIARVVDILLRQSKNNPALIGKAGVGKTAIVEGLAQRVAAGDVPPALKEVRVVALDHVALLAGTTFRGQYEERIRKLVRELSADPDLILFVDELHNLIGQGTALGAAMDAANMLKPALVRGDIRIIGATTGGEYDKWIRGDPALERRFQPVLVEELDAIQTWEVMAAQRPRMERHDAVAITDDARKAATVLTDRFVPERARPDKAIDVLDEACAHAQATAAVSPELDRLIRERRKVDAMIRRGLTHETPQSEPAEDLVAEIFPMLERIGAEIEKMLGGGRGRVGEDGGGVSVREQPPPTFPNLGCAPRRARPAAPPSAGEPGDRGEGPGRRPRGRDRHREGDRVAGMRRRWLAAGALLGWVGPGSTGCQKRAQEVRGEAELRQSVQQMMPAVERATRLRFKQHPVVLRRSRAQVRDYVIHKFDDDLPPAELAGAQAAYRLFGLIPDSLDLRRSMVDLLTEQVAGYFDPDSNALYIPADIDPSQARLVISHELVHALQHQYLNLDSLVELKRQNDRRSAAQAILEGQATLAQILVLMPEQKIEILPNFSDLRARAGGVRDPPVVGATPGRRQRRRVVRDGLGWRPLPGARAEEGEPRWGGGGRRARVVHAVG